MSADSTQDGAPHREDPGLPGLPGPGAAEQELAAGDAVQQPRLRLQLLAAARSELRESGRAGLSLRAVARRAGVSHAAPAYAFRDRSGLLTAVAAQGFRELAAAMDAPTPPGDRRALAALGRRYVDFATADPALYDLMFRTRELDVEDPELQLAREASLRALVAVTTDDGGATGPGELTMLSWTAAHGIAALAVQGLLADGPAPDAAGGLPRSSPAALVDLFAALAHPGR